MNNEDEVLLQEVQLNQTNVYLVLSQLSCPRKKKKKHGMRTGDRCLQHAVIHIKNCGKGEGKMVWPESDDKKRIAAHKRDISAAGGGQSDPSVSSKDDRIAAVTGETSIKGICQAQRRLNYHKVESNSISFFAAQQIKKKKI